MHKTLLTILLLASSLILSTIAATADMEQPASDATSTREFLESYQEMISGVSENSTRAPFGRFLLMKNASQCLALRITEHSKPQVKTVGESASIQYYGAKYEWFLQADGSMDFSKDNIQKGTGEVFEKGPHSTTDNLFIQAGAFRFEWSLSDWIYFPAGSDTPVSMTPTEWVRLEDVDPKAKYLRWHSDDRDVVWGEVVDGLQMGVSFDSGKHPYYLGSQVFFALTLRNVGQEPIKLTYHRPIVGPAPRITDGEGRTFAPDVPAVDRHWRRVTQTLSPGKRLKFYRPEIKLGPLDARADMMALETAPGKYRVSFPFRFDAKDGSWSGTVESGQLELEILAAPTPTQGGSTAQR